MNTITSMKQIRIERQKGFYGLFRTLKIVVDGDNVAELKQGRSIMLDLPIDAREIWGEMDWGKTKRMPLDNIDNNKVLVYKGFFTFNHARNVGVKEMPFKVFYKDNEKQ